MLGVIGGFLPFAVGIALSPTPIAAVVLMLNGSRGAVRATIFTAGSVIGVALVVGLATIAAAPVEAFAGALRYPSAALSTALIVVGAGMIAVAVGRLRRRRPQEPAGTVAGVTEPDRIDEDGAPERRTFLARVQRAGPLGAFLTGFVLSSFTVKNLGMWVAAALIIGSGHLAPGETLVAVGVFTAIGRLTLILPIVLYVVQRERAVRLLSSLAAWFGAYGSVVTVVVLFVLGVTAIGSGLSDLSLE